MDSPTTKKDILTSPAKKPGSTNGNASGRKHDGVVESMAERPVTPSLSHRLKHDKSILALVVSASCIYAGTEDGEILVCSALVLKMFLVQGLTWCLKVYSLDTYKRNAVIEGHRGSVLALCLSEDEGLLFSSAGDRFVNVNFIL